ncbi:RDD family protein [Kytococcus aerolatus]|uniref:RDD family protein n=1 Tax=Kytococcus aerolatus TaxID=592308 RepID=A0A212T4Z4_9MICO|nr:RDD family protein [Kytococcus aerolatus]
MRVNRREIGSWLSGPRAALPEDQQEDLGYPGERLGLPESGVGSVARFGPRVVALFIDWFACLIIAGATWGNMHAGGSGQIVAHLIFLAENVVLVAAAGGTLGHRLLGMQVVRLDGQRVGVLESLLRGVLLALALPALVWDRDQRGMHDWVPRTVLLRTR